MAVSSPDNGQEDNHYDKETVFVVDFVDVVQGVVDWNEHRYPQRHCCYCDEEDAQELFP
jgi:hypothetical protein